MDTRALTTHIDAALRAALGRDHGRLLVAVSGGADSMALWDLLSGLPQWSVSVFHLNHQLRIDADADAELIRRRHALHGPRNGRHSSLIIERCDIAASAAQARCSIELAGRRHRYARLTALACAMQAVGVVTAHHRDDQAETVLGNLLRGAGLMGRAGIAPHRLLAPGVRLVRPLLRVGRHQLRAYAQLHALEWREDSTNADTGLRRNLLRLRVLPSLEAGCPGITDALVELGQCAQDRVGQDAAVTAAAWQAAWSGTQLDLFVLGGLTDDVRRQVWRRLLIHLEVTLERRHIMALEQCAQAAVGARLTLGHWLLTHHRSALAWQLQRPQASAEVIALTPAGEIRRGAETIVCAQQPVPHRGALTRDGRCVMLDRRTVAWPLVWRLSEERERWLPLGSPGRQTVVKYLANRGVASRLRPLTPVIADQQGILWIPGHGIAERAKVRDDTSEVLRLEWRPTCQEDRDARVASAPDVEISHGSG